MSDPSGRSGPSVRSGPSGPSGSSGVSGWTRSVARTRDSMRALLLTWVLSRLPDTIMKVQGPKAQLGHNTTLLFSRGLLIPSLCRLLGLRPASVNSHMLPKNFELRTLSKHTDVVKSISTSISHAKVKACFHCCLRDTRKQQPVPYPPMCWLEPWTQKPLPRLQWP